MHLIALFSQRHTSATLLVCSTMSILNLKIPPTTTTTRCFLHHLCGNHLQVGPGFVVAQASDHKSETLAKT